MQQNCLEVVIASHKGKIKKTNEDSGVYRLGTDQYGNNVALCAVADGMGGLAAGDRASRLAVECLNQWWDDNIRLFLAEPLSERDLGATEKLDNKNMSLDLKTIAQELGGIFHQINRLLIKEGEQMGMRIGTTLSVLFLLGDSYFIVHIGDSRIYHLGYKAEQLSEDHSWVAQQVRTGKMTQEEADNHPSRHILTDCLGVIDKIHLCFNSGSLQSGDTILICSDGFYTMVAKEKWESYLLQSSNIKKQSLQLTADELVQMANNAGGKDNITVLLVRHMKKASWFSKFH